MQKRICFKSRRTNLATAIILIADAAVYLFLLLWYRILQYKRYDSLSDSFNRLLLAAILACLIAFCISVILGVLGLRETICINSTTLTVCALSWTILLGLILRYSQFVLSSISFLAARPIFLQIKKLSKKLKHLFTTKEKQQPITLEIKQSQDQKLILKTQILWHVIIKEGKNTVCIEFDFDFGLEHDKSEE